MRPNLPEMTGCALKVFRIASHAGVLAGLYVTGATVCFAQVAGIDGLISLRAKCIAVAFTFCTSTAVYILDRVKLRDAWLDPADAEAHPSRFQFVSRHSRGLRMLMLCMLVAASWLGSLLLPLGAVMPLFAAIGVYTYAGRPRRNLPRPKDILTIKNLYVAIGIAGFSCVVVVAALRPNSRPMAIYEAAMPHALPSVLSLLLLAARVFADAVLCDLDDENADRRFGTVTLPTVLGHSRAWSFAFRLRLLIAIALVVMSALPALPRMSWAVVTVASSVVLRAAAPSAVRDWVDARLIVESVLVALVLSVFGG